MELKEALNVLQMIKDAQHNYSLSDEHLREYNPECTTREKLGIGGRYEYGIWMVPEEMVLDIAAALLEEIDRLLTSQIGCLKRLID
jgi:hypothetical protein